MDIPKHRLTEDTEDKIEPDTGIKELTSNSFHNQF